MTIKDFFIGILSASALCVASFGTFAWILDIHVPRCSQAIANDNAIRMEAQDMASFEFGVLCGASHSVAECASIYIHKDDPK